MHYYAQLNNESIVVGISALNDKVNDSSLILLESYDTSVLAHRYENEKFIYVEPPKPEPVRPSLVDVLGQEIAQMKIKNIQQQTIIDGLDREIMNAKLEIMQLKGAQTV